MARIDALEPDLATGQAKQLLNTVNDKYGMVPNLARTLANSPAALHGYLSFGEALESGLLPAKLREQIALTVSEANGCGYCVAAHCAIGQSVGLSDDELGDATKHEKPQRLARRQHKHAHRLLRILHGADHEPCQRDRQRAEDPIGHL